MPRKNRVWYPGAIYHVMSRGNRKDSIFYDEGDYHFFLEQVKEAKDNYHFKIHSLCLMTNHFHLQVETGDVELSKIMSKILCTYAMFFNSKHSLSGHLFGDRYKAYLINSDAYFLEVNKYIHLNPVKAMIVKSPEEYRYSSYPVYVSNPKERPKNHISRCLNDIVDTSRILSSFGYDREQYRRFIEGGQSPEGESN